MKIMKVLLKLAAAGAVLLLLAALLVPMILKKYLPPDKVRELIVENARKYLHREVRLKGVELSAMKGLTVSGLEISEAPDFKAGTFAKAETFELRVDLMPLLHGTVAVDRISLGGLRLTLKKVGAGRYNFSDISGSSASLVGSAGKSATPTPMVLDVRHIAVSDGRVSYADAATGDSLTLSEISAQISDLSLDGETQAEVSFKVSGKLAKRPVQASVSYSGTISPAKLDLDKVAVSMAKASVDVPEGRLQVSGTVKGARSPVLDLKTQFAPPGSEPISADVAGKIADAGTKTQNASLTIKAGAPALKAGSLKTFGVPEGLALPAFKLEAVVEATAEQALVKSLRFETDGAAADVSGSLRKLASGKPEPDLTVSMKASAPKITPLIFAVMKAYKMAPPDGLAGRAAELSADLRLQPDAAEVKALSLKCDAGSVSASGRVRGLASGRLEPELDVDAKLSLPELKAGDLAFLKAYKVEVPPELDLPPAKTAARLRYTKDALSVAELLLENQYMTLKAGGEVRGMRSKPSGTVNGSVRLRLPALTGKDLSALKLIPKVSVPAALSWPATEADAVFRFDGSDFEVSKLHVKNPRLSVEGSASVRKLTAAPSLTMDLKAELPAFESSNVAFVAAMPPDLKVPASKFEARLSGSQDAVEIGFLKLAMGRNSVAMKGSVKSLKTAPFFSLAVDCPGFVLEELTDFSPQTREMGLKGVGRFRVFVAGEPSKGTASYKGDLEFRGIRLAAGGVKLSEFNGKGSFDEGRINFPSIAGKLDDGNLEMDLSVKNYLKSPFIEIQKGTIDSLDVGKLLAAKDSMAKTKGPSAPAAAAPPVKPFGIKIWDSFTVQRLVHPFATLDKASLKCNLTGVTPDFKQLDGTANFSVGGGHLLDLDKIAEKNPLVKVMAVPILIMRGIGIFPNLKDIGFSELTGDYDINKGVVDIKEFHLSGDKLFVNINEGRVDLPRDKVKLDVQVKAGVVGLHKVICGSISKPDGVCAGGEAEKLLKGGVGNAVDGAKDTLNQVGQPVKQILDIFKK
ncbi:MAG: AsmA family protein [Elusimicrobia bacterium]|nr:AsmA family protein [Elusimicrobiota bacterium]